MMVTTSKFKKRLLPVICFFWMSIVVNAQGSLEKYIETGLKNNLVLQEKNIGLESALNALKTANSLFFPSVDVNGDYQSGDGGRSISIPVGDMLNPVYRTLNQLTSGNAFPDIPNVETNFFPQNYYDLKVRTSLPVINSDLIYNHTIRKQQVTMQEYDVEIYKSELIRNIQVAYYNYLSAAKSIAIYDGALSLAREARRMNQRLLDNGKSLKAYVLRSESEIQSLEAKRTSALQQMKNDQMYFNFILNTNPDEAIDTVFAVSVDHKKVDQYLLNEASITKRTELKALDQSASICQTILKMNKAYWVPKLNGFLDLGSQACDWKFNNRSKYYFFGFQLDFPLFSAGKNRTRIKQSELDLKNQLINNTYTYNQIRLSAGMARNSLMASYKNYAASIQQLDAAMAYDKLIEKGYREGINAFIETVDARNQLTAASLQLVIDKYQLLAALATYEREINK
ncbi:MAG: TolC family protein [Bacteroidetes bacterium]|nr:TolC family protein [Bacteroidota bacterium]